MPQRVDGTRHRLLDLAERLLAERGVGGASLREISLAAGQRNVSAVQYHFGSKEGLLRAIFERRMTRINERRLRLLAELEAKDRPSLRDLLTAFVQPIADEMLDEPGGTEFVCFVAHALQDPDRSPAELMRGAPDEALRRLNAKIFDSLSNVPPDLRRQRMEFVGAQIYGALAARIRQEPWAGKREGVLRWPVFLANLVDVMTGALNAPVSDQTLRAIRTPEDRNAVGGRPKRMLRQRREGG